MGIVQRFERKLQGAVGDAFARVFGGSVVPQEVEAALQHEAADHVQQLEGGHMLAPNVYVITINTSDHEKLSSDQDMTMRAFSRHLSDYIHEQGWQTYGDIHVEFEASSGLHTGQFRTRGRVDPDAGRAPKSATPQSSVPATSQPGAGPMTQNSGHDPSREPADSSDEDQRRARGDYPANDPGYAQRGGYAQPAPGQPAYQNGAYPQQNGYDPQGYGGYQNGYDPQQARGGYQGGPQQGGQPQGGQPQGGPQQGGQQPNYPAQAYSDQGGYPDQGYQDPRYAEQGYQDQGYANQGQPNQGYPNQGYPNQAYSDQGYPSQAYSDQGYQDQGYQDQGYANQGYAEPGYADQGYQDQGYAEPQQGQASYGQQGYAEPAYGGGYAPGGAATYTATLQLDDGSGRTYQLREGANVIGRGQEAQFRLPDTGVSRRHIEVRWDGHVAMLSDLGSTNGTLVNGAPVQDWQLADGDVIRAGHSEIIIRIA